MPRRLRPTAPFAAAAVLVGDPGRALLLAQELLQEPKMSNHARGLWGYGGQTASGAPLTIQSTGIGGPSAAVVLTDLAKLGVRQAIRIGTCVALDRQLEPGALLVVDSARAEGGSATPFGAGAGETLIPDAALTGRLQHELSENAHRAAIASFDTLEGEPRPAGDAIATDMQTATLLACGRTLGLAVAAVLIVETAAGDKRIEEAPLEEAAKLAGRAAEGALSP